MVHMPPHYYDYDRKMTCDLHFEVIWSLRMNLDISGRSLVGEGNGLKFPELQIRTSLMPYGSKDTILRGSGPRGPDRQGI